LGISVGKLRTHEDKKVADLAKETVKKWKNDVAGHKDKPASASTSNATAKPAPVAKSSSPVVPTRLDSQTTAPASTPNGTQSPANGSQKPRDANVDGISKVHTNDKIRDSCIILLYNAICSDSTECIFSPGSKRANFI
jgi:transcription elongation factor S-II